MVMREVIDLLINSPFADGLETAQLRTLSAHCRFLNLGPGVDFCREREPAEQLGYIVEGWLGVFVEDLEGTEREVARLGPGRLVGEAEVLTSAPCAATVRSLTTARLLVLRGEDLAGLIDKEPRIASALLRAMVIILGQSLGSADARLANRPDTPMAEPPPHAPTDET